MQWRGDDFLLVRQGPVCPSFPLPSHSFIFSLSLISLFPPLSIPVLRSRPLLLIPYFPFPSVSFYLLYPLSSPPLPLEVGPWNLGRRYGGALKAPPVESGAEPQPKSNSVHFSFKICYQVADYAVGLQYAVKKYWWGEIYSSPYRFPQLVWQLS